MEQMMASKLTIGEFLDYVRDASLDNPDMLDWTLDGFIANIYNEVQDEHLEIEISTDE